MLPSSREWAKQFFQTYGRLPTDAEYWQAKAAGVFSDAPGQQPPDPTGRQTVAGQPSGMGAPTLQPPPAPPEPPIAPAKTPAGFVAFFSANRGAAAVVTALVCVLALIAAGLASGFLGSVARSSIPSNWFPHGGSTSSSATSAALAPSFANGYRKGWTVSISSLMSSSVSPDHSDCTSCDLSILARGSSVTAFAVRSGTYARDIRVFGVDNVTGKTLWGTLPQSDADGFLSYSSCAPQIVDDTMYCIEEYYNGTSNHLVAIDAKTGKTLRQGPSLFTDGSLGKTNGNIMLPITSADSLVNLPQITLEAYDDVVIASVASFSITPSHDSNLKTSSRVSLVSRIDPVSLQAKWTSNLVPAEYDYSRSSSEPGVVGALLVQQSWSGADVVDIGNGHVLFSGVSGVGITDTGKIHAGPARSGSNQSVPTEYTDTSGKHWSIIQDESEGSIQNTTTVVAPDLLYGKSSANLPKLNGTAAYDGTNLYLPDSDGSRIVSTSAQSGQVNWTSAQLVPQVAPVPNGGDSGMTITLAGAGAGIIDYPSAPEEGEQDQDTNLAAFDTTTGKVVWSLRSTYFVGVQKLADSYGIYIETAGATSSPADEKISFLLPVSPQARSTDMPASIPSCPTGWTPVTWSTWAGNTAGHTLVCSSRGSDAYYITYTDGSQTCTDMSATSPTLGVFTAACGSGATLTVSLGGNLTQYSTGSDEDPVSHFAQTSWYSGVASTSAVKPTGTFPTCPAKSYPLDLSIWSGQWLLTCATDGSNESINRFYYYNGSATTAGTSMATLAGLTCGVVDSGGTSTKICYQPGTVTVGSSQSNAKTVGSTGSSTSASPAGGTSNAPQCANLRKTMGQFTDSDYGYSLAYPKDMTMQSSWGGPGQLWQLACGAATLQVTRTKIPDGSNPTVEAKKLSSASMPAGSTLTYHPDSAAATSSNPRVAAVQDGRQVINSGTYEKGHKSFYIYTVCGTHSCVNFSYFWDKSVNSILSASDGWITTTFKSLKPGDLTRG